MTKYAENIRLQVLVVIISLSLLVLKFVAYFITHSNAIFTDALESIINVIAGSFALYALVLTAKPQDENHPYGHGKIEFIAASIEGLLILLAGLSMIGKAGYAFFYPEIIHSLDIGIILSVIAGLVNYLAGHYMYRKGTKTQSITLVAGGHHLKSDAYSTVGIVIGLAIIYYTEFLWLDNVIALVFGGIIIFTGYKILKKSVAGIMDEVDNEVVETIAKGLGTNRMPNWVDVHNLRVIKYGSRLHVDCHLTLPYYFDIKKAHEEVAQVEMLIDNMFEDKVEVFIHTDACLTTQCAYCLKTDCAFRSAAFQNSITWTASNITKNQKHSLV